MPRNISSIVQEVIDSLNKNLKDPVNDQAAANEIIRDTLKTAFSYSGDALSQQRPLWKALQIILAQDLLKSNDNSFATFLISKGWEANAQKILNDEFKSEDILNLHTSLREEIVDFCVRQWEKRGRPSQYLRKIRSALLSILPSAYGVTLYSLTSLWTSLMVFTIDVVEKVFPLLFLYAAQESLEEQLDQFKTHHEEAFSAIKKIFIDHLRVNEYNASCSKIEEDFPDLSYEEMQAQKEAVHKFLHSMDDEAYVSWHSEALKVQEVAFDFDQQINLAILDKGLNREIMTAKAFYTAITQQLPASDHWTEKATSVAYRALLAISALVLLPTILVIRAASVLIIKPLNDFILPAIYDAIISATLLLISLPILVANVTMDIFKYFTTSSPVDNASPPSESSDNGLAICEKPGVNTAPTYHKPLFMSPSTDSTDDSVDCRPTLLS